MTMPRLSSFFFLATLFCCTWEKVHWTFAGNVELSDMLALCFLASFLIVSRPRVSSTTAVLLGFFAVFLVVYLIGFYNLDTPNGLGLFVKGMIKFAIQFSFLAFAVTWLWRRGQAYYWRALGWFCGGMVFNGIYGVLQLLVARSGGNLDAYLVKPLTGGASQINLYGIVEGADVYRANALTDDPNHLGIMVIVPLLVLTPLYLRLEREHRLRRRLGAALAFLLIAEATTLSRSGVLGLLTGAVILTVPYRRYIWTRALIAPLVAVVVVLGAAVAVAIRPHYFLVIIQTRLDLGSTKESGHFKVYSFIPKVLHSHPLFGLGWNTFSIYYQFVTGLSNWGPHSFYVALIVETGIVGTVVFASFLFWVFVRLRYATHLGRAFVLAGDPRGARVVPLAWGWTAALAGTMAANVFYLSMQFYYFYVFLALALAVPLVFGLRAERGRAQRACCPRPPPPERRGARLRSHHFVPALSGGRRREVRRRARRAAAPRRSRGGRRLAGRLLALRDRLRLGDRPEPASQAVARARAAAVLRGLRARGAPSRERVRRRSRALARLGAARACYRQAVRPPAVGQRRRARPPTPLRLPLRTAAAPGPGGRGRVGAFSPSEARRARSRLGRRHPGGDRPPRGGPRPDVAAARPLRGQAEPREGNPRLPGGDRGDGPGRGRRR